MAKTLANVRSRVGLSSPGISSTATSSESTTPNASAANSTAAQSLPSPKYQRAKSDFSPDDAGFEGYPSDTHHDDDDSDFETPVVPSLISPPRAAGYQPSPIAPQKPTYEETATIVSPGDRQQVTSSCSLPQSDEAQVSLSDFVAAHFRDIPLDQIRDESGDVDYRLLLDPARKELRKNLISSGLVLLAVFVSVYQVTKFRYPYPVSGAALQNINSIRHTVSSLLTSRMGDDVVAYLVLFLPLFCG